MGVDKKLYAKHVCYDIYFNFINALMFSNTDIPTYTFKRKADNSGFATTDGNALKADGSNEIPVILNNQSTSRDIVCNVPTAISLFHKFMDKTLLILRKDNKKVNTASKFVYIYIDIWAVVSINSLHQLSVY